jgi:UDP-glucose 4-epimerase
MSGTTLPACHHHPVPVIFVTGGAGYIGSHTVLTMLEAGMDVVVYDNMSSGHREALPDEVPLVHGDLTDTAALGRALDDHHPDAVVHFAGSIEAGESMTDPRRFYRNNLVNSLNLADAVVAHGAIPVVFSSTAAVYGDPEELPVSEDAPKTPTNVYGESKLAFERVLAAYDRAYGLRSISLRYFNACGAYPDGHIGADHRAKTHLLTLAMLVALGQRDHIDVYGTDWPTPDGTCIRDYIHVCDLADAHVLALRALADGVPSRAYNVGVGRGFSVQEMLDGVDRVVGHPIARRITERRPGDPSALVADSTRIRAELGWAAKYTDLDDMIRTAWAWHQRNPHGYAGAGR